MSIFDILKIVGAGAIALALVISTIILIRTQWVSREEFSPQLEPRGGHKARISPTHYSRFPWVGECTCGWVSYAAKYSQAFRAVINHLNTFRKKL